MAVTIDTRKTPLRILLWLILLAYLAVLSKLIIFKKPLAYVKNFLLHHYSWEAAKQNMHKANLTPFATIKLYLNSHLREEYIISNLLGNIVGFIPLGILLPLMFRWLRSAPKTIIAVFLFSLGFELFQLFTMLGVFDVDDLLLNTLGGAIGYVCFSIFRRVVQLDRSPCNLP